MTEKKGILLTGKRAFAVKKSFVAPPPRFYCGNYIDSILKTSKAKEIDVYELFIYICLNKKNKVIINEMPM